jgi:Ca2+-binding RTX toxin-like protein
MRTARSIFLLCAVVPFILFAISPAAAVPPSNDEIANATQVASLPYSNTVSTVDATRSPTDPYCVGGSHNVWYTFTPENDMRVLANTFGSSFDTTLSVYTGSPGSLTQIACNDDSYDYQNYYQSRLSFNASAETTYYFMAGSYADLSGGSLTIRIGEAPEIELYIDSVGWANVITGGPTITGSVICSVPADVRIDLMVTQRHDGRTTRAFPDTSVSDCGVSPTAWKASSSSGNFRYGQAVIEGTADAGGGDFDATETAIMRPCTEIGTLGDDRMEGTRRADKLCGLQGNDTLIGSNGDDMFFGFEGADLARGGSGGDDVYGGNGRDVLKGEGGNDLLNGADGTDSLEGGSGIDRCVGGKGQNTKRSCERR